jgi:hypothetical protein
VRPSHASTVLLGWVTAAVVCCSGVETRAESVTIAGNVTVTVNSAINVGGGLAPDSDSTTYSVINTIGVKKLIGRLSAAMPSATRLDVQLAAPSGATSAGVVTLTASDQNLVTGIGVVTEAGLDMTFTLSATVDAGLVNVETRTLTLTLVDAP